MVEAVARAEIGGGATVIIMTTENIPPLKSLKWYRKLAARKGRLEAGAFVVEGERAVRQLVDGHADEIIEIIAVDRAPASFRALPCRLLAEDQFAGISQTRSPQGILAVVSLPAEAYSAKPPPEPGGRLLLLEDIQDPGNVGGLIRTAAAFGFSGVIITPKCADPFGAKAVQSTAGSILSVWLRRTAGYQEMLAVLKEHGYSVVAADLEGDGDVAAMARAEKLVLALGSEAAGLSAGLLEMADLRLRLPIAGDKVESLNVAACGAVLMYLVTQGGVS